MIFQAYQTFTEFNNTGLAGLFLYPPSIWGGFIPLLLSALFLIVMMATLFGQQRTTGKSDFKVSFAVSGFFTVAVAFVMTLVPGLIDSPTLGIVIVVAIIGAILLLTSGDSP
ncbi:hypothetical protein LCGC14_2120520 [marine sediment metagenome]|uniref:Uncharacterized protein n=1 Tax=marine sediment metagenome TaxID=412755 RepID=A0A0F9E4H1_9ZZZZ